MNKPYGFAASVTPSTEFHEERPLVLDGIEISVLAGRLEVSYDHEEDEHEARHKARILVDAWRARTRVPVEVGFDQATTWKPNSLGGRDMFVSLSDQIAATDRLTKPDNRSLLNDIQMTVKASKHKPLEDALRFYSQEGLDPKRPLYGIFKALEAITHALRDEKPDGRTALGKLVDESKSNDEAKGYVGDIMQTANTIRHAQSKGTAVLSETECKERAYRLICAYAASLP